MKRTLLCATLTVVTLLTAHYSFGQTPSLASATILKVGGEVSNPLKLSASDLVKMSRVSARAKDHYGRESVFEGVPVGEILKMAGVRFGEQLRGKDLALYLLVEAADGYRAVFALPEVDAAFNDTLVLLADRRDGKPLSDADGALQIIVPNEKRHARWVRQVVSFTIRRGE